MATYFVDPENGTDSQAGQAIIRHTGLNLVSGQNTVTLTSATGIVAGMKVLSVDLQNSGGHVNTGTTVASVSGDVVTLSENIEASTVNGTLVFSAALKTITAAVTAAGPGDTVRIKRSKDPINTGITGTWTHLGTQVLISEPATVTLDNCDVGWAYSGAKSSSYYSTTLNSTNGTLLPRWNMVVDTATAAQGTGRLRLQWYWPVRYTTGANATNQSTAFSSFGSDVNGSFSVFYQNFASPLDLTDKTRVSFWYLNSFANVATFGTWKLQLCADVDGVNPVATFNLPAQSAWAPRVLRNVVDGVETAIGTTVRSLRIYVDNLNLASTYATYNGSTTIAAEWNMYFDNVVACLPESNPKAITHNSLIGKNKTNGHWYALSYIDDTVLGIDTYNSVPPGSVSYTGRGYTSPEGTTEEYTVYRRGTLEPGVLGDVTFSKNGIKTSPITYSGGWDDVTMTTKTGHTFFRSDFSAEAITFSGDFNVLENIGVVRSTCKNFGLVSNPAVPVYGWVGAAGFGNIIRNCYGICNRGGVVIQDSGIIVSNVRNTNTLYSGLSIIQGSADAGYSRLEVDNCSFDGSEANGSNNTAGFGVFIYPQQWNRYRQVDNVRITNCSIANNRNGAIHLGTENRYSGLFVGHSRLDGAPAGTTSVQLLTGDGKFVDCKVDSAAPVSFGRENDSKAYFQNFNQVNNDHRVYLEYGRIEAYTGEDRQISTGLAWRLKPQNATRCNILEPIKLPICQVYCDRNKTVTVTAHMRRDSIGTFGKLVCRGGQIAGIVEDVSATLAGGVNAWVQLTLTLQPTQSGVVEIEAHAWGGSSGYVDVDNISVSQA